MLLPFLLVFVVVFAILQKSKIFGEGKQQIDAIVGVVIGLIVIGFGYHTGFIVNLMAWLAVGIAVILVFMVLYGFVAGDLTDDKNMPKALKYTFGALAGVFTIAVVLYISGFWDVIWYSFRDSSYIWMNIVFFIIILGVVAVAVFGNKKSSKS
jgi:hypothetical protein